MEKFKIRVMTAVELVVYDGDKLITRKCFEGEDVFVPKVYKADVVGGLYRPYKPEIVFPVERKRERIITEEKSDTDKIINNLGNAINAASQIARSLSETVNAATELILKIKNEEPVIIKEPIIEEKIVEEKEIIDSEKIDESFFIDPNEKKEDVYDERSYKNNRNYVRNFALKNILQGADMNDGLHDLAIAEFTKSSVPKFALINKGKNLADDEQAESGHIIIPAQGKIDGLDIFDQTPVSLDNQREELSNIIKKVVNDKGEIDIEQSFLKTTGLILVRPEDR